MKANQTAIPLVQTSNDSLNQVQQNANKVFRNLNDKVTELTSEVGETLIIGEVKIANLTLSQFQSIAGKDWVLCDGSSCVGSAYTKLTGNTMVPTLSIGSVNNFIRIN